MNPSSRDMNITQTGKRTYTVKVQLLEEELVDEATTQSVVDGLVEFSLDQLKQYGLIPQDSELKVVLASSLPDNNVLISVMWKSASLGDADGESPSDESTLAELAKRALAELVDMTPVKQPQTVGISPIEKPQPIQRQPQADYNVYIVCDTLDAVITVAKQMKPAEHLFEKHIPIVYKDPVYMDYVMNIVFPCTEKESLQVESYLLHICDYDGVDVYESEDFSREYFAEHGEVICKNLFTLADI